MSPAPPDSRAPGTGVGEGARVVRGAAWLATGGAATQALGLATSIATARALGPSSYGVVGMALVVVAFVNTLRDVGFGPAISSGRMHDARAQASAHWLLCALGALCALATLALAPVAARFFEHPQVDDVLRVMSPSFVLSAASAVPLALLQREGRFATGAAIGFSQQLVTTLVTLVMLWGGAGLWALVVPGVIAAGTTAASAWVAHGRSPMLAFDRARLAPFLREGLELGGFSLFNAFSRNADNAVVGRLFGEHALGRYAFAYGLLTRPLGLLSHSLASVLVPSFGRLSGDAGRFSEAVVRAVVGALRIGAPLMVGGALTCHLLVPLVFGPKWQGALFLCQTFMLLGAVQLVGPLFGALAMALGHSTFILRWGVLTALVVVPTFLLGGLLGRGPEGVAVAYFTYSVAQVGVMYVVARRRFGLALVGLPGGVGRVARDVVLMAAGVLAVDAALARVGAPPVARLVADVVLGAGTYLAAFRLLSPREASSLLGLMPAPLARLGERLLGLKQPGA